jgi:hypothetical protein
MRGLLLLFLTFALTTQAQRAPQLGYVYPAGGRQGATSQVVIGGQFLGGATGAFVSGEGIRAIVTEVAKPMNQGQFNQLRAQLRALQERKLDVERAAKRGAATTNVWTAADEKQLAEIREKIIQNPPNRNVAPALAETVTLRVTIAEDAAPGTREIRLVTPGGLSNPLVFQVGQLPEFSEPAARAANPDLDRFLERLGRPPAPNPTRSEMRIRLPPPSTARSCPARWIVFVSTRAGAATRRPGPGPRVDSVSGRTLCPAGFRPPWRSKTPKAGNSFTWMISASIPIRAAF